MTHLVFKEKKPIEFTEDNPPSWLLYPEFKWWWDDHVLTLKVGKHIKSDFQKIKRLS